MLCEIMNDILDKLTDSGVTAVYSAFDAVDIAKKEKGIGYKQ